MHRLGSSIRLAKYCYHFAPKHVRLLSSAPRPAVGHDTDNRNVRKSVVVSASTSPTLPPLVRSLLLKAASLLPSQQAEVKQVADDPVSSLFLRSRSSRRNSETSHGLEFLVDVSKKAKEDQSCFLEEPFDSSVTSNSVLSPKRRTAVYMALAKARLSGLVVLTTAFGYGLAVSSSAAVNASPFAHFATVSACLTGTALLAAGANTLNQFFEAPYDSQMPRTRNRPLAVRAISPEHALGVGITASLLGTATLALTTNPVTTAIGVTNCLLYASVYTSMKRTSPYNTWVGAVVGALPPLMGWSAATGGPLNSGAYVLACLLFSWQFPHFMALSWNMRAEYARAGYQVLAVVNAKACRQTAMRHSVILTFLCSVAAPLTHLSPWSFALASLPVNIYLLQLTHRFQKHPDASTARSLFRYSLIYLPSLLTILALTNYVSNI